MAGPAGPSLRSSASWTSGRRGGLAQRQLAVRLYVEQAALDEAAVARPGEDPAVVVDHRTAAERGARRAGHGVSVEDVVVDVHERGVGAEREAPRRVEDDQVGVGARGDA